MSDKRIPDDFTEYDSKTFEHAAEVYTGGSNATVTDVDDDNNTVTVETDQGTVEMESDDHGFARVKGTSGE
jgi:preprotein translocase subunit YajC